MWQYRDGYGRGMKDECDSFLNSCPGFRDGSYHYSLQLDAVASDFPYLLVLTKVDIGKKKG